MYIQIDASYGSAMSELRDGRTRNGVRLVGLLVALALILVACGGSGQPDIITYKDPNRYTLFKVPGHWNIYEGADLAGIRIPFVTQGADFELPVISQVAFDGSPSRDPSNITESISTAPYPIGVVAVRAIGDTQRDLISRFLLAELVVPYHNQPASQELLKEDFEFDRDYEGVQLAVAYTDSTTNEDAAVFLISVTDPEVTRMYSIAVGCSLSCFNQNQEEILAVVDSYLVNTRE